MRSARVLSNVWWPTEFKIRQPRQALTVWLNSSLGLLTVLAQRTSTEGGWVAMKKADLTKQSPILETRRLTQNSRVRMFDETEFDPPGIGLRQIVT